MRIAFLGGGNMAQAMLGGLIKPGFNTEDLVLADLLVSNRDRIQAQWGIEVTPQLDSVQLQGAEILILAVKPQQSREALHALPKLPAHIVVLSILAGVPCAWIAKQLGISEYQVVRAMPNTPALIRKGVTGVYASSLLGAESKKQVQDILQSIGTVLWVDQEEQLDAVTALSGSGPAFVFYWLEGWLASAVRMGFTEAEARQLVLGTLDGALGLVQASPVSITELRRQVTSPGGTTAAALEHLEHQEWQKIFQQALEQARHRARTLAQELEKSDKDK